MPNELVSLRDERERTIARLSDLFANDEMELDEFERRLTVAHRATSTAELAQLLSDMPGSELLRVAPSRVAPAGGVREAQSVIAIFGGARRRGQWTCARRLKVTAVFGGTQLDFREARLAPGVTEVAITAVMGGVEIIVPPDLAVETEGVGVMGGFEAIDRSPPEPDPERPILRIRGLAVMGGVHIETRLPGERERDARKRRRQERRERRALDRGRKLPELPGHDEST